MLETGLFAWHQLERNTTKKNIWKALANKFACQLGDFYEFQF